MIISYGLSLAGRSHIEKQIVCQDSHIIANLNNGWYIAAVADGVGSAKFSDKGSSLACEALVSYIKEHISEYNLNSLTAGENGVAETNNNTAHPYCKLLHEAYTQALAAIKLLAEKEAQPLAEYDTTLTSALYNGADVVYGQSGDGGIIGINMNGDYKELTKVQKGEQYNHVYPLRAGSEMWGFGVADEKYCALLLATDGILDAAKPSLLFTAEQPFYVAFIRQFIDLNIIESSINNLEQFKKGIEEYFYSPICKAISDDMTVAAMINSESMPVIKDDIYYAEPNWAQLRQKSFEKLYPNLKKAEQPTSQSEDIV